MIDYMGPCLHGLPFGPASLSGTYPQNGWVGKGVQSKPKNLKLNNGEKCGGTEERKRRRSKFQVKILIGCYQHGRKCDKANPHPRGENLWGYWWRERKRAITRLEVQQKTNRQQRKQRLEQRVLSQRGQCWPWTAGQRVSYWSGKLGGEMPTCAPPEGATLWLAEGCILNAQVWWNFKGLETFKILILSPFKITNVLLHTFAWNSYAHIA